jgi:sugar phosphate isomerase/epimerase
MNLGFSPPHEMDYQTAIETAGDRGFDFVELYTEGEQWHRFASGGRAVLEDAGVALVVHLPFPLNIGSPLDAVRQGTREELRRYLRTASDLGTRRAVLHPNSPSLDQPSWDMDDIGPHIIESATSLSGFAEDHDVELTLENIPFPEFDLAFFGDLLSQTELSMTLDTGHAAVTADKGADIIDFVENYSNQISHLHLNDNRALDENWPVEMMLDEDEHLPILAGTVPFDHIFEQLRANQWTGTATIEVVTPNFEYIDISRAQIQQLIEE